jgi:cytoskeletal protein CcmA (bactofilin family)
MGLENNGSWFKRLFSRSSPGSVDAKPSAQSQQPARRTATPVAKAPESTALATGVAAKAPAAGWQILDRENNLNPVLLKVGNVQSTIGGDVEIDGDLRLKDSGIRIKGIVRGDIIQEGNSLVIIDKDAQINGEIRAKNLLVLGSVVGSIKSERLVAGASASIEGDVTYRTTFAPVPGAKIRGKVQQQDEPVFQIGNVSSLPASPTRMSEERVMDSKTSSDASPEPLLGPRLVSPTA